MPSRFTCGHGVGTITVAGMPSRAAASATPCPWLPADAVTTPRARSSGAMRESLSAAPRSLNEPVACSDSSLSQQLSGGANTSGVLRTKSSVGAVSTKSSVGAVI